ncbi:ABC transporter ATP-binding protein [Streptomyces kutzneri]|uniref:ABC transporter ATP-binding protein n=1 Tax=Streptomyces kutzneri TaxID=3051179 RepID=UPI0028D8B528|nr:ABC transporter ATP-binding protein [Streptomyces sp. DSM 40907]
MDTYSSAVVDAVIRLVDVRKVYGQGDNQVSALNGVSMEFHRRAFTAVMGPSGSGKSTLLQCAAGLDEPTSGSVQLAGRELAGLSETELTLLRREQIGFIFQSFNLLPALTAEQNVCLPLQLAGRKPNRAEVRAVLEQVGLKDRRNHRPGEMSGGQQQRVAIARALVSKPAVIFADEPTGALDTKTAASILNLMRHAVQAGGQTIVMVTHDPVAASYADRVVFLADGQFAGEIYQPTVSVVAEHLARLGADRLETQPAGVYTHGSAA